MAAVEIRKNPQNITDILDKFYTPEEPEMTPEEMMLAQQQMGGMPGMPQGPGPEPDIASVLAGLTGGGPVV